MNWLAIIAFIAAAAPVIFVALVLSGRIKQRWKNETMLFIYISLIAIAMIVAAVWLSILNS